MSNDDLSHCHWLMRIPTVDQSRSMNLGQAVAVCLYEIARSSATRREPKKFKPATMGEIEQITQMLLEAGRRSGYINPVVAASSEDEGAAHGAAAAHHAPATSRCGSGFCARFCGSSEFKSDVHSARLFVHFVGGFRLAQPVE